MASFHDESVPQVPQPLIVDSLTHKDILIGRGSGPNRHVGNKNFRDVIVKLLATSYLNAQTQEEQQDVFVETIALVYANGGRFLKKIGKMCQGIALYQVVTDTKLLCYKMKQAFRYATEKKLALEPKDPAPITNTTGTTRFVSTSSNSAGKSPGLEGLLDPLLGHARVPPRSQSRAAEFETLKNLLAASTSSNILPSLVPHRQEATGSFVSLPTTTPSMEATNPWLSSPTTPVSRNQQLGDDNNRRLLDMLLPQLEEVLKSKLSSRHLPSSATENALWLEKPPNRHTKKEHEESALSSKALIANGLINRVDDDVTIPRCPLASSLTFKGNSTWGPASTTSAATSSHSRRLPRAIRRRQRGLETEAARLAFVQNFLAAKKKTKHEQQQQEKRRGDVEAARLALVKNFLAEYRRNKMLKANLKNGTKNA